MVWSFQTGQAKHTLLPFRDLSFLAKPNMKRPHSVGERPALLYRLLPQAHLHAALKTQKEVTGKFPYWRRSQVRTRSERAATTQAFFKLFFKSLLKIWRLNTSSLLICLTPKASTTAWYALHILVLARRGKITTPINLVRMKRGQE